MAPDQNDQTNNAIVKKIGSHLGTAMNAMNDLRWQDARAELAYAAEMTQTVSGQLESFLQETISLFGEVVEIQHNIYISGTVEEIRSNLVKMKHRINQLIEQIPDLEEFHQTRKNLKSAIISVDLSDDLIPLELTLEFIARNARDFRRKVIEIQEKFTELDVKDMIDNLQLFADIHDASIQLRIAKRSGDKQKIALREADYSRILENMKTDDVQSFGQIVKTFISIGSDLRPVISALGQMDLDTASTLIDEAKAKVLSAEALLDTDGRQKLEGKTFDAFEDLVRGLRAIIESYEAYIKTLLQAVQGDVTTEHLNKLYQAEIELPKAVRIVSEAFLILNVVGPNQLEIMEAGLKSPVVLMKNLRRLANSSKK